MPDAWDIEAIAAYHYPGEDTLSAVRMMDARIHFLEGKMKDERLGEMDCPVHRYHEPDGKCNCPGPVAYEWSRGVYQITMQGGARVEVDGMVMTHNGTPSLGVHMGVTQFVDVTHIPSGARMAGFSTIGAAFNFVERVGFLRDWTTAEVTLNANELSAINEITKYVNSTAIAPHTVSVG